MKRRLMPKYLNVNMSGLDENEKHCMQGKNFIGGVVGGDNAMVNNLMGALSGGDC